MDISNMHGNFIFPQMNLKNFGIEGELHSARKLIRTLQNSSSSSQDCFLSFYPLAKNIRFVSSHFYNAVTNGRIPVLSNISRRGEDSFWLNMTSQSWYPWLWTRYFPDAVSSDDNRKSWSRLFKSIEDPIELNDGFDSNSTPSFILYLACLGHVFRLNENLENYLQETYAAKFPDSAVCGLQIRRGEIVPKDGDIEKSWKIRQLFSLDDYMKGAIEVCKSLKTKTIFLSSDSAETLHYLEENYPDYHFISNRYDSSLFVRFQGDPSKVNLERDLQMNPSLIKHYTETCLIDLYMLSQCQGFVGGMKHSEYGVCGWFLQMIKQKAITPYFNIEGEFELNGFPVGMLLN